MLANVLEDFYYGFQNVGAIATTLKQGKSLEQNEKFYRLVAKSCFSYEATTNALRVSVLPNTLSSAASKINTGVVLSFKDSVVTITGLRGVKANELIYFDGGSSGIALNLEYNIVKALVFGGPNSVSTLELVRRSSVVMRVGVGPSILGRIVSPLGLPIDGRGLISHECYKPIERKAPGVITRKKINQPVETGLKVVDALVPIGRGQRELILGDRKTGKTTVALDAILHQKSSKYKFKEVISCVYVAVGKRMSEIVRIYRALKAAGTIKYTTLIVARSSDPASLQFIAPYSACTMAEHFTYKGGSSLIVYDDLSRHADAYRQISLLLRRPVGREAYPGDIFYLHSRLLERAVKLDLANGLGSLTALPIIETIQGDVSAYIPTNVISITDGQIYLDLNRHQEGVRPAVDPGLSVSRVGSSAQAKLMKRLSGSLKLELAQFREVEQFSKFGSELDPTTRKLLFRGRLMVRLLKQDRSKPLPTIKQLFMFYISNTKFFEANVATSTALSVETYFRSLFFFIEFSFLAMPTKVVLELYSDIPGRDVFMRLFFVHFRFLMERGGDYVLALKINRRAFFSAFYENSVDSVLKKAVKNLERSLFSGAQSRELKKLVKTNQLG